MTNIAHPVRWYDTLEVLRELGAELFVEIAPPNLLTSCAEERKGETMLNATKPKSDWVQVSKSLDTFERLVRQQG